MSLDQDPGVLLVGLPQLFAGGNGGLHQRLQMEAFRDAGAGAALPAERRQVTAGVWFTGLAFAQQRHGDHQGQRVLTRTRGAA